MKAIFEATTKSSILLALLSIFSASAVASNVVNVTEFDASFEDIRLGIENSILENGFVIDFNGNLSKMLENTANVADDVTPVFMNAEFWQFCSSAITRRMTKADPMNIAYCPFVIFAFETTTEPGTITIGYRPLPIGHSPQNDEIFSEINKLLENIVVKSGE